MKNPPETDEFVGLNADAILRREAVHRFWTKDVITSLTEPYFNAPTATFWCIGAPYVSAGKSEEIRENLKKTIVESDKKIRELIADADKRRESVSGNLGL